MSASPLPPLRIRSGQGDYDVHFVADWAELERRVLAQPKAVLVADRKVAGLYREPLKGVLEGLPTLLLDATEEEKTLAGVEKVVSWLQRLDCTKQTTLVCLGGGIMQDLCTVAAHLYYRGLKLVLVPTTLLSMSDSCIGAKCGINLNQFKNQLGVFHSPGEVLVASRFVQTLDDRDVASGHGEILKLLLTGSEADFERYERALAEGGLRTPALDALIRRSLEVKQGVIEADEYEKDLRRILNYGHTFGHALEVLSGYHLPHGLGVAWGIDVVNYLARERGMLADAWFQRVHALVARHLPFKLLKQPGAQELVNGARRDKKVADGAVNLVLLERPGTLRIVKTPFSEALTRSLEQYLREHDVYRP